MRINFKLILLFFIMDKNAFLRIRAQKLANQIKQESNITENQTLVEISNQTSSNMPAQTSVEIKPELIKDKYNPDVIKKYTQINDEKNRKLKVEHVPEYYKTITNQPILKKVSNVKELQLEKDKPDHKKTKNDYNISLDNRIIEKNIVNKSIKEFKKKNNINEISIAEQDIIYQQKLKEKEEIKRKKEIKKETIKESKPPLHIDITDEEYTHNKLKSDYTKYNSDKTDKIAAQKQRYTDLINSISDIIN